MQMRKILFLALAAGAVLLYSCSFFHHSRSNQYLQHETIEAIRDIGVACEAYHFNNHKYIVNDSGKIETLEPLLVPTYLKKMPMKDGWGRSLEYFCVDEKGPYYIISH